MLKKSATLSDASTVARDGTCALWRIEPPYAAKGPVRRGGYEPDGLPQSIRLMT